MSIFLQNLPKIELHAHLNGSLCISSMQELSKLLLMDPKILVDFRKKLHNFENLDECFEIFKYMHELTSTKKGLETATFLVIRDFAADNVIYLELRTTPKATELMSKRDYMISVLETIKKAKLSFETIDVKLVPSIDRSKSVEDAEETVTLALELRKIYPNMIVGIDFSGDPMFGNFIEFKPILEKAFDRGLKLAVHCAEIESTKEIQEMINFGMERCGHGTHLSELQIYILQSQNAAIECCLTSNVKCKTVESYEDHHFKKIFKTKTGVVLCTDDAGVFDTTLTKEFFYAVKYFDLKREDVYRLSMHAVKHSFANDNEKAQMKDKIDEYFEKNANATI